jgi:hypothetical protein
MKYKPTGQAQQNNPITTKPPMMPPIIKGVFDFAGEDDLSFEGIGSSCQRGLIVTGLHQHAIAGAYAPEEAEAGLTKTPTAVSKTMDTSAHDGYKRKNKNPVPPLARLDRTGSET